MSDPNQVPPTEAEALDAASRVLNDPPIKKIMFMGTEITLRPLPLEYSEKLYKCIKPIRESMAKLMADFTNSVQKDKTPPTKAKAATKFLQTLPDKVSEYEDLDLMVAHTLLDASVILAGFYGVAADKDKINKEATLTEVEALVKSQLEVNSNEDFLLRSFSSFMKDFLGTPDQTAPFLDLLSTLASAKAGK